MKFKISIILDHRNPLIDKSKEIFLIKAHVFDVHCSSVGSTEDKAVQNKTKII